jgi:hypothetical protein
MADDSDRKVGAAMGHVMSALESLDPMERLHVVMAVAAINGWDGILTASIETKAELLDVDEPRA